MKVAIMTDLNSGIKMKEAKEMGIYVLQMPIIIDDDNYFEGENLTSEVFFDSLSQGKNVKTSQPSPGDVLDMWDALLDDGYDEIVYIPMSSGLSTSCECSSALAQDYDGKVCVVDNHRISVTQRQSVMDAISLVQAGKSALEIKQILEEHTYDASIYISVDTLEYLQKGGRASATVAALGNVLNIKPILTIQGAKLDAFAVVRGRKKCEAKIIDAIRSDLQNRFADVPPAKMMIGAAGTLLSQEEIEAWKDMVQEAFPEYHVFYNPLSLSVGSHIGPNALAIGIAKIL